jgi:ABC-type uncharacterized transport system permease subunit
MSMHSVWKLWLHLGNRRPISFSSNSDKHTAHSMAVLGSESGWVLDEKTKIGSELRTAGSNPRVAAAVAEVVVSM